MFRRHHSISSANSPNGFTVFQALIVLTLTFATLPPLITHILSVSQSIQTRHLFSSLSLALHGAQMSAVSQTAYTYVSILPHKHEIRVRIGTDTIRTFRFAESIDIIQGTHDLTISFSPNGHIRTSGSFYIRTPGDMYKLVLLLGQGRFYIEKIS